MSDLLTAIRAEGEAADTLTRACARRGAIADAMAENPMVTALKRSFRKASFTPNDMLATLGKIP
jgi:hypothetical protein